MYAEVAKLVDLPAMLRITWQAGLPAMLRIAMQAGALDYYKIQYYKHLSRGGEIGRRAGFRFQFLQKIGGSSPLLGTRYHTVHSKLKIFENVR